MVWIPWQSVQTGASQLPRTGLPVNALHVDALHIGVALAAGGGNIELVDRRLCVVGGKNLMRAMAVRADRRGLRAVLHRVSVDAVLVGHKDLRAAAGGLHQKLLAVACAAGGGNVGVIDGRLRAGSPAKFHARRRDNRRRWRRAIRRASSRWRGSCAGTRPAHRRGTGRRRSSRESSRAARTSRPCDNRRRRTCCRGWTA